jgi:uncharacterized membrane protein
MNRIRNYFLTGLVIAAPLFITVFITWTFIEWIDGLVQPLVPSFYRWPFVIPGFGVLVAISFITLLGFLTANLLGRRLLTFGESILGRMPLVRNLYSGLKQIFETALSNQARAFQKVALVEYPRKGLWSIAFVSGPSKGEIDHRLSEDGDEAIGVFMPTTPNPTSGYLIYVKRSDLVMLDMTVEDAAKLVISAGLVTPKFEAGTEADLKTAVAESSRINPPSAA